MTAPVHLPVRRLLRLVGGERIVFQTVVGDRPAVARVLVGPVPLELDGPLTAAIQGRAPASSLPPELAALAGAGAARASLGALDGLPEVLGGGVARLSIPGSGPPPDGQGHAHILSRWVEGPRLTELRAELQTADKLRLLAALGRSLARVHGGLVAHGRVRPNGIVLAGPTPWLVELEGLVRVAPGDARLADDVMRYGELGAWLLEPELSRGAPELQSWRSALDACRREPAAARPGMAELLVWLGLMGPAEVGGETIAVADPTTLPARQPGPVLDPPTEFVPDPAPTARPRPAAPGPGPSTWMLGAVAIILLVLAVAIGLSLR